MSSNGAPHSPGFGLAANAPDPAWHKASCWPGGSTTYVIWDAVDENETVPPTVRAAIATALWTLGPAVFLGGVGAAGSNEWKESDGSWTGVSQRLRDRILRKPGLRFIATRNTKIIETLFDQQGFDWNLRGQMVFVLEGAHVIKSPNGSPDNFAACLKSDPPQHAPRGCIAILRPGTDGGFAEFHAISRHVVDDFMGHFRPRRGDGLTQQAMGQ